MVKLSARLMLMADQIEKNETMADIGTDHGFLPMYLADEGICPKVILTDVSAGSLKKAQDNVNELVEKRREEGREFDTGIFDFRLGDGITVLEPGEADAIVIAGMGGILISEILEKNMEVARTAKRIIMQPRKGSGRLRYSLIKNGFEVERELLVREGKFICEVIVAAYAAECGAGSVEMRGSREAEIPAPYGDISYSVPEKLLENGSIALEYIKRKLNTQKRILSEMENSKSENTAELDEKRKDAREKIAYYEKLLEKGDTYDKHR